MSKDSATGRVSRRSDNSPAANIEGFSRAFTAKY